MIKKHTKKRILATIMLAGFLFNPNGNNFVLPSINAIHKYHCYNTTPIEGLVHPLEVPEVKECINNELKSYVDFLTDEDTQHGTYYVSNNYFKDNSLSPSKVLGNIILSPEEKCEFKCEIVEDTANVFRKWQLEKLDSENFIKTKIDNDREWKEEIVDMPCSKALAYVPRKTVKVSPNSTQQLSTDYMEKHYIPLLQLKTTAFATYLHCLAGKNPKLNPKELFNNERVKMMLERYWGNIFWVENTGAAGIGNAIGNILSATGIGDAINEVMGPMNVKKPQEVALSVYYDSADWYQRLKYKLGRWGAFGFKTTLGMMLPIGGWKFCGWACEQIRNMALGASIIAKDQFLAERNKLLNDPIKLREAIKKMMQAGVVGLTDTIDRLTTLVTGNLALRKSNSLINRNRCQLISFVGPPGTGKSLLAQKYALALTGKEIPSWGYITSASIKPGISPVDQFFDVNSNLIKNLKRCKGNTVIFIDEIDKFDSNDLLECLRDAVDRGTIVAMSKTTEQKMGIRGVSRSEVINTESIDVSGLIVIVGTNEKPECWGLEPDPDEPAYNVGRTVVERSQSLVQRFQRFKFNPYTVDEYKQMYDNALKSIYDESEKMFGLKVEFDENLSKHLARESEYRLMGGRSVAIVLSEMAGAITSFDINANDGIEDQNSAGKFNLNSIKNYLLGSKLLKKFSKDVPKRVKVSFDSNTHKFIVEQICDENVKSSVS